MSCWQCMGSPKTAVQRRSAHASAEHPAALIVLCTACMCLGPSLAWSGQQLCAGMAEAHTSARALGCVLQALEAGTPVIELSPQCQLSYGPGSDPRVLRLVELVPPDLWSARLALQASTHASGPRQGVGLVPSLRARPHSLVCSCWQSAWQAPTGSSAPTSPTCPSAWRGCPCSFPPSPSASWATRPLSSRQVAPRLTVRAHACCSTHLTGCTADAIMLALAAAHAQCHLHMRPMPCRQLQAHSAVQQGAAAWMRARGRRSQSAAACCQPSLPRSWRDCRALHACLPLHQPTPGVTCTCTRARQTAAR